MALSTKDKLVKDEDIKPEFDRIMHGADMPDFDKELGENDRDAEGDRSASPQQLGSAEGAAARGGGAGTASAPEQSLYKPKTSPGDLKTKAKSKGATGFVNKHKKALIIGGGAAGGSVMIILLFVVLLLIIAPYKEVHFATVLRSIGLARFTYVMNKQFGRIIFESAVLTDSSTGHFRPPANSLYGKVIGINPAKQLAQLGTEGSLKFQFDGKPTWGGLLPKKTTFKGVVINGQPYSIDGVSQASYGKDYADLTRAQARKVRSSFTSVVETKLSSSLALESRRFRWGVYKGFYQATGIRLFKWTNKAKDYLGLSDKEARVKNVKEIIEKVDGANSGAKKSGITEIDEPAEQKAKNLQQAAADGSTPGEVRSKLAERVRGVRGLSTTVMIITLACVVHSIAQAFDGAAQDRETRAARMSGETQSAKDQTQSGDTVAQAVGAENALWDNAQTSVLYRTATGQPTNDAASQAQLASVPSILPPQQRFASIIQLVDTAITGGTLTGVIPGLGEIHDNILNVTCNVLLNEYVQSATALAEIVFAIATAGGEEGVLAGIRAGVSAGLQVGASVGLGELIGQLIDNAIDSLSNTDFSGIATGPERFNQNYVAMSYSGQVGNRQMTFGAPMSSGDADAAQLQAVANLRNENGKQSFTERYFAMDNPFSLSGNMAATLPTTLGGMATSLQQGFASLVSIIGSPQRLFSSVANIFTSKNHAYAKASISRSDAFGIDNWGWTPAELAKIDNDPSFDVTELIQTVEPRLDSLNQKYGPCYSNGWILQADTPTDPPCKQAGYLTSDEALHWRVYMADTYAAVHLTGPI